MSREVERPMQFLHHPFIAYKLDVNPRPTCGIGIIFQLRPSGFEGSHVLTTDGIERSFAADARFYAGNGDHDNHD